MSASAVSAPSGLSVLDRRILHEAVADRLRDRIVEGALPPGAHLNERVLCEQLGVSRTPLREAFRTLAGEGIVALLPNRGAQVAVLSREDVAHAFELMAVLESLAGELAAVRATVTQRRTVKARHREMLAAHARRDLPGYYRLNSAIHRDFVAMARNPMLAETYGRLNARLQALRFRSNLDADKWALAMAEHSAMIEALDARDSTALAALMRRHLEHKRQTVLAQLDAQAGGPPSMESSDERP